MSEQLKARFAKIVDDLLAGKKPETASEVRDRIVISRDDLESTLIPLIAHMESEVAHGVALLREVFHAAGLKPAPRVDFEEHLLPYESARPSTGMFVTSDKSRIYVSAIVKGRGSYFTVFEQKTAKPRGGERWGADVTAEGMSINIDHAFETLFADTVAGRSRKQLLRLRDALAPASGPA